MSHPTRHRTRHQGTILLIDTLLAISCHRTRLVVCPAVSDTLRAVLTMSQSLPTYSSHVTCCRSRRQNPDCHPPHRHHTCCIILTIVLAARVLTILLIDIVLAETYVSSYASRRMTQLSTVSDKLRAKVTMSRSSPTYLAHLTCCHTHHQCPAHHPPHRYHTRCFLLAIVLTARV